MVEFALTTLFRRRKDERRDARLRAAIETTERARQSFQPKPPRVVIDTSYVADDLEPSAIARAHSEWHAAATRASAMVPPVARVATEGIDDAFADDLNDPATPDVDDAADCAHIQALASHLPHPTGQDLVLMQKVMEELDLAARREAAALDKAARLQAAVDDAHAALRKAEAQAERAMHFALQAKEGRAAARDADRLIAEAKSREAEATKRIAGAMQEAKACRERAAELEAAIAQEHSARRVAEQRWQEAKHDAAQSAAESAEQVAALSQALAEYEQAHAHFAEAGKREAAALCEADAYRQRAAELEALIATEHTARLQTELDLQAARDAAAAAATQATEELAALREVVNDLQQADDAAAQAAEREAAARQEVLALQAQAQQLEALVAAETSARQRAERRCQDAEQAAAAAVADQGALGDTLSRLQQASADAAEAAQREQAARLEADGHRARIEQLEAALAQADEARREAEARYAGAMGRAEDAQQVAVLTAHKALRSAPLDDPAERATGADHTQPAAAKVDLKSHVGGIAINPKRPLRATPPRERRQTMRMPVTIWNDALGDTVACTMLDQSGEGADIEVSREAYRNGLRLAVGDRFTMTFQRAKERTSVSCNVEWVEGVACGIRYLGQFHTEIVTAPKRARLRRA